MRYLLEVSSRAVAGREADYNKWYSEVHIGEVLTVPGFISCLRYKRMVPGGATDGEFVAHYTVETDDPPALLQALYAASPNMQLTDAIDLSSVRFEFMAPA